MSGLRDDQDMGLQPSNQDPSLRVHSSLGNGPSGSPPTRESRSPFQKARSSRDATVTAPLGAAPFDEAPCVWLPGSPVPVLRVGVGHRARALAGPKDSASLGAFCQPAAITGFAAEEGAGGFGSCTDWFGESCEGSVPLPLSRLQYPWGRHARSGVTVAELLARPGLRPDLLRIRRIHEAGLVDESMSALRRLMAEGGCIPYQIPDAIPVDRTFAYSLAEVEYVDRMATFLFGRDRSGPRRFILSEVAGLYVSPRPYAYAKSLVALQKSASSLMRLHSIAVSPHDWAAYRQSDEEDGRVFRSSAFEQGLSPADFPPPARGD